MRYINIFASLLRYQKTSNGSHDYHDFKVAMRKIVNFEKYENSCAFLGVTKNTLLLKEKTEFERSSNIKRKY